MQTFDQHLYQLYSSGRISVEEAIRHADSRTDLTLKIRLGHGQIGDSGELQLMDEHAPQ